MSGYAMRDEYSDAQDEAARMKITSYNEQNPDGSGLTDDRTRLAYSAAVLANILRSHSMVHVADGDAERERLYQLALNTPSVCDALDILLGELGVVWSDLYHDGKSQ